MTFLSMSETPGPGPAAGMETKNADGIGENKNMTFFSEMFSSVGNRTVQSEYTDPSHAGERSHNEQMQGCSKAKGPGKTPVATAASQARAEGLSAEEGEEAPRGNICI